ncbi:prepilin peptidase, partial [Massilia horti]
PAPLAALGASLLGALAGLLMFLPLYALGGTAAGDVKLMATVGAFVGAAGAFEISVLSWCAGGVMGLAIVLVKGRLRPALANVLALLRPLWQRARGIPAVPEPLPAPSVGTMPYGLAIAVATLFALVRHA